MYSLPSTSVRREPSPLATNSGYGAHPDQVARAVLLTPPGMVRQAAPNRPALMEVSMPGARPATPAASGGIPMTSGFTIPMEEPSASGRGELGRQRPQGRVQAAGEQRGQQADRIGESHDGNVGNIRVPAMFDQAVLGEHVIGFAGRTEIRCTVSDQEHAMVPVVFANGARALAVAAPHAAVRIGERRLQPPAAWPVLQDR